MLSNFKIKSLVIVTLRLIKQWFDWFYLAGISTGAPTYSQVLPFDPLIVLNHLFIVNL